jgi:hypothetical protein
MIRLIRLTKGSFKMLFKCKKSTNSKIFCIGRHKTGTTSMAKAFSDLGYKVGNQTEGEWMFESWFNREFSCLNKFCEKADAFQDMPFCMPFTFAYLDQVFPNSKFILTIRDSAEQWYQSFLSFHAKLYASDKKVPTDNDLKRADFLYKGFTYRAFKAQYNTPDNDLYNKEILIKEYETHNNAVIEYFKNKPNQLLILNVAEKQSYQRLCAFLNKKPVYNEFPWELKTENLA